MVVVLKVVVFLAVLIWVVYPFFQRFQEASAGGNERRKVLQERKSEALAAIKELELDFQMGKLSAEDYQALRAKYEAQAVAVLKELDKVRG